MDEQAFLVDPGWAFREKREAKDIGWAWLYAITFLGSISGGVYAWTHMNPDFAAMLRNPDFLSDPEHCAAPTHGRSLLEEGSFDAKQFLQLAGNWMVATAVISLVLGALLVHAFRYAAHAVVYGACAFQVAILVSFACTPGLDTLTRVLASLLALFVAFAFCYIHRSLHLVARLLSVSSEGIAANPMVVPLSIGLNVVHLVAVLPLGAAIFLAASNGSLVSHPKVHHWYGDECVDSYGDPIVCCKWVPETWVYPFAVFAALVIGWTILIFSQMRNFTIAGVITQWYFHGHTRGTTLRSLGHATSTSFGSICLSALVLSFCNLLRFIANNLRSRPFLNIPFLILSRLLSCWTDILQGLLRAITRFATVHMAATGDSFLHASRNVTELLSRNFLSAYTVWWLPSMVLECGSLALSIFWGVAVYAVSSYTWQSQHKDQANLDAIVLGVFAGAIYSIVLSFMSGILRNVVDTVYICYARDLDYNTVTKEEIHNVYKDLPAAAGAVVVQPDEALMYGAADEGRAGPQVAAVAEQPGAQQDMPSPERPRHTFSFGRRAQEDETHPLL